MYVRLKHTLSALALEAIRHPARGAARSGVRWLVAFCDLTDARASAAERTIEPLDLPLAAVAARAGRQHGDREGGLRRVLRGGLLQQQGDVLSLPAAYRPHFPYMHRQVHRLTSALRALARTPGLRGERAAIVKGAALFNAGLFFECHEFVEDIWRAAASPDRAFYQGVILIAAGFYHYEKGNLHGARIKLAQGIVKLEPYRPSAHGVRLDRWMDALAPWMSLIEAGRVTGVLNPSEIPRIPLAGS